MIAPLWIALGVVAIAFASLIACVERSIWWASRSALEERARAARLRRLAADKQSGDESRESSKDLEPESDIRLRALLDDQAGYAGPLAAARSVCVLGGAGLLSVGASAYFATGAPAAEVGETGEIVLNWPGLAVGLGATVVVGWLLVTALPLAIAEHAAERTLLALGWIARLLHAVGAPLRGLQAFLAEVVRRLAGVEQRDDLEEVEAEILSLVEESEREGTLDESAREMIEAVVEFRTTTAEQIMTPRTEIEALEYTDDFDEVKRFAEAAGHSRIPVYRESLDQIAGLLYVKDLLKWLVSEEAAAGGSFDLSRLLREPTFFPESKTVADVLQELLAEKVHIAFITDEYGGTSGLITIEDIIEEVFGEIQDEYEPEDAGEPRVRVDEETRSAEVDARAEIDEANDELESIGLHLPEHEDYDTVGGFVVVNLGKIPQAGESLRRNGVLVTVLEAEPTRVTLVRVEPASDEFEG